MLYSGSGISCVGDLVSIGGCDAGLCPLTFSSKLPSPGSLDFSRTRTGRGGIPATCVLGLIGCIGKLFGMFAFAPAAAGELRGI